MNDTEESHGWLHVPCALFQEIVQGTFLLIILTSVIESRPILWNTGAFEEARAFEQPRTFKLLLAWRTVRHLRYPDAQSALWVIYYRNNYVDSSSENWTDLVEEQYEIDSKGDEEGQEP